MNFLEGLRVALFFLCAGFKRGEDIQPGQGGCPLCRTELAPLGESGGTVQLKIWSGIEAAFRVEEVEDRCVDGCEFLQTSKPPKAQNGPFPSSKWQVGILRAIVQPAQLVVMHLVACIQRQ